MENNHRGGESSLCGEERIESLKVNDKRIDSTKNIESL